MFVFIEFCETKEIILIESHSRTKTEHKLYSFNHILQDFGQILDVKILNSGNTLM